MSGLDSDSIDSAALDSASRETPLERLAFAWGWVLPVSGVALLALRVAETGGAEAVGVLAQDALFSLLLIGKFVVFWGLRDGAPLGPAGLAATVWLVDIFWAFVVVGLLARSRHLPMLGRTLERARTRARQVLDEYPRLARMAFGGVALLVFLPLAATGAITGSFAAQIVGLRRIVGVAAVTIGSGLTSLVFALMATFVGERAEELLRSPVLAGVSAVLVLVLGRVAYVRVKRILRT